MYPNLYFFLKEAMGIEPWGFTQYINTFGLLVAIAFVVAAVILSKELKRREQSGLLSPMEETIVVGKPASKSELLFNLVFGFIVGYKILGVFLNDSQVNPQDYIFSSKGSLVGGLILGGLFSWLKYHEKKKLFKRQCYVHHGHLHLNQNKYECYNTCVWSQQYAIYPGYKMGHFKRGPNPGE